jgi:hypothetical protein
LRRIRWEDYEIEGPGAEEWRRRHAQWSHKSLFVTAALVGLLVALVLLELIEPREILEQAVRFSFPILARVEVVRAESRHVRLM